MTRPDAERPRADALDPKTWQAIGYSCEEAEKAAAELEKLYQQVQQSNDIISIADAASRFGLTIDKLIITGGFLP